MTSTRASKKQLELLKFVDGFIKGNGYGPSYREIMRSLGYKSVSTVAIHVENLITKGYLRRTDKSARSLEVVTLETSEITKSTGKDWKTELHGYIAAQKLDEDNQKIVDQALEILKLQEDESPNA